MKAVPDSLTRHERKRGGSTHRETDRVLQRGLNETAGQTTLISVHRRFVGRAWELDAIREAMASAERGVLRTVHLIGEAGIGKTTLAEQVSERAAERGWSVAWGRGWNQGSVASYWLWHQVIAKLTAGLDVLDQLDSDSVSWLVDLVPQLSARGREASRAPSVDAASARAAIVRSVAALVRAVSAARPLLVVLDDLHDADPASVVLTDALVRGLHDSTLLLVTTQRPSPALAELNRQGLQLPIEALGRDDVEALVGAAAAHPPDADLVDRLWHATGGNPFYLDQVVRHPAGATDSSVRSVTGQALRARLSALGAAARSIVDATAVMGDEAPASLIATVSGFPPADLSAAMAEVIESGVLRRSAASADGVEFGHALLREAAYAALSPHQRRDLHQRVAAALDSPAYVGRAADLAYHSRAALPDGDPATAARWTVAAAKDALRVFAYEEAERQCSAALVALSPFGQLVPRETAALLGALGEAHTQAGDLRAAREVLNRAIALGRAAGDIVQLAEAVLAIPRISSFMSPDRELEAHLRVALDSVGDSSPALRARLLARRAAITSYLEQEDVRAMSAEAVALAEAVHDPAVLAEALSARAFALWSPETTDDRLDTSDRIIALAVREEDLLREMDGRMWRLIALLELGRVSEAEAELDQYELLAERLDHPSVLLFARSRRAMFATMRGRFEEAERLTREAYQLALDAGAPDAPNLFGSQLGEIARLRGGPVPEELATMVADKPIPSIFKAWFSLTDGRAEEAASYLTAGLPELTTVAGPPFVSLHITAATCAAELNHREGFAAVRQGLLRLEHRFAVGGGAVGCWGSVAYFLGVAALALGDVDDAIAQLRQAVAENERAGVWTYLAFAEAALADALATRGNPQDTTEARRLLTSARDRADQLGMLRLAQQVRDRLSALDTEGSHRIRLTRDGELWALTSAGPTIRLRHRRGVEQLSALLANPWREIPAVELAGISTESASRTPLLDTEAKQAYRRKLLELDTALDRASECGDANLAARLDAERTALVRELKRAAGLGGRGRRFSDDAERARVNVTRTIRQAIDQVVARDPELGGHLLAAVRTGNHCAYEPDRLN